jgi:hydrogenase small subunit
VEQRRQLAGPVGHGCIGCSEPNFWDKGSFYRPLSAAYYGDAKTVGISVAAGAAAGLAAAALARGKQKKSQQEEKA